jgi:hypothetical protein
MIVHRGFNNDHGAHALESLLKESATQPFYNNVALGDNFITISQQDLYTTHLLHPLGKYDANLHLRVKVLYTRVIAILGSSF